MTRQEALTCKSVFYFGKNCKFGHLSERYTSNSLCVQCSKIRSKSYKRNKALARTRYEKLCFESPSRFLFDRAKHRAKVKNLLFNISLQDIEDVWPKDNKCPALGIELEINIGKLGSKPSSKFNSPSLDRIDPKLGYVKNNIAVISLSANQIKGSTIDSNDLIKVACWMKSLI